MHIASIADYWPAIPRRLAALLAPKTAARKMVISVKTWNIQRWRKVSAPSASERHAKILQPRREPRPTSSIKARAGIAIFVDCQEGRGQDRQCVPNRDMFGHNWKNQMRKALHVPNRLVCAPGGQP